MKNSDIKKIHEAMKSKVNKQRYTFTLSPHVKAALARWCTDHGYKESTSIEKMLLEYVPAKYFKRAE